MKILNGLYDFKHFDLSVIELDSQVLKKNPLGDPTRRRHPVLIPKSRTINSKLPVVLILSGYLGNGDFRFNLKAFEENQPQQIDRLVGSKKAPPALYVFVDAFTYWGGSQFINSALCGKYEDMIVKELVPKIKNEFPVDDIGKKWMVMGGSSGGYGALHLSSSHPKVFPWAIALAPDSLFEVSLLPELYEAQTEIANRGGLKEANRLHKKGKLLKSRNGFKVLNALAMSACYGTKKWHDKLPHFPFNTDTLEIDVGEWKKWLEKDPVRFIPRRKKNVKLLKGIYLACGKRDQFQLHYGSRRIRTALKMMNAKNVYDEFDGGHFDLSTQLPNALSWQAKKWRMV